MGKRFVDFSLGFIGHAHIVENIGAVNIGRDKFFVEGFLKINQRRIRFFVEIIDFPAGYNRVETSFFIIDFVAEPFQLVNPKQGKFQIGAFIGFGQFIVGVGKFLALTQHINPCQKAVLLALGLGGKAG